MTDLLRWEVAALAGRLRVTEADRDRWRARVVEHGLEPVPAAPIPAHVYLAIGLRPEVLRTLTRVLTQRITVAADHLPVVLTDCPSFRAALSRGVVLEYLPDARTWRRHRPGVPWDDLLTERLTRIFLDHGCARTVVVDPESPPALADLLA